MLLWHVHGRWIVPAEERGRSAKAVMINAVRKAKNANACEIVYICVRVFKPFRIKNATEPSKLSCIVSIICDRWELPAFGAQSMCPDLTY